MKPVPQPAPFGGVNEQLPIVALQAPYCENLLNFNITQEGVTLRNGDSKYALLGDATAYIQQLLVPYGNTNLFEIGHNTGAATLDAWDADTGLISFSLVGAVSTNGIQPLFFNNYLFIFTSIAAFIGERWDGSIWAGIGYTGTGTFRPFGGNVYKNRAYLIQFGEAVYWYTEILAVTGATIKVDLNSIISQKSNIAIIARVTLSDVTNAVDLQVFVMFSGEVLYYSGNYPNSADWELVGRAQIDLPLDYGSGVQYKGDFIAFCESGPVSLRDIFLKGQDEGAAHIQNENVRKTWKALVAGYRTLVSLPSGALRGVRGVYDSINKRVIISFPVSIDSAGTVAYGNYFFIFYTVTDSWYFHRSFGTSAYSVYDLALYRNKVVFAACGATKMTVYTKEGGTNFQDRSVADNGYVNYDYEIKSAPIAEGRAYVQRATGMDVIVNTDLYAETSYYFIKDFGVTTTTAQKIPTQPVGLQKPMVNMGIEGSYIQYKISGTTAADKTVGYQLYGTNVWIEEGQSPR